MAAGRAALRCLLILQVLAAAFVASASRLGDFHRGGDDQGIRERARALHPEPRSSSNPRSTPGRGGACDLCARNWLFVLSAYRTGSTTALSMLSSIPGFEIGGEHNGVLVPAADVFKRLHEAQAIYGAAFDGSRHEMDPQLLRCNVQDMLESVILGKDFAGLSPRTAVLGFKEIRYNNFRMLRFISEVFPCSRFVFTIREDWTGPINAKGLDPSRFEWVHNNWRQFGELARRVHEKFPASSALLPLEKISVEAYNEILHGMGGVNGCNFTKLLHENLEGSANHDPARKQPFLSGDCDMSGVDFRLAPEQLLGQDKKWEELKEELEAACQQDKERCVLMA